MTTAPLRLHWWKAVPNFGDTISAHVVAHVSGRAVEHSGPAKADLFAIGSMLQTARRSHKEARSDGYRTWIWGTGTLGKLAADFLPNVRIACLRGPISADLLGLQMTEFGDPGLLINEVITEVPERGDHIGIVPHHTLMDDPVLHSLLDADPGYRLIDPRGDAGAVCREIAGCKAVFASSLHGLIVADAYGVPNVWLEPTGQQRLKYYDYAAGIGRPMIAPLSLADVPDTTPGPITYQAGIDRARRCLKRTFPVALRAETLTHVA